MSSALALTLLGCGSRPEATSSAADPRTEVTAPAPNVIFILTDDLDWKLMPYLRNVQKYLVDQGTTMTRYYVEESTCCTSRSTIMTGEYAHNHRVLSNFAPSGGYRKFHRLDESTALPTWLEANPAVLTRGLLGKYLNEYPFPYRYQPGAGQPTRGELARYVPDGWNQWLVPADGQAYKQRHYRLNDNGDVQPRSTTFLDDVIGSRILGEITQDGGVDFAAGGHFVEWASYSPHLPYAHPAKYDRRYRSVSYPRDASFNEADTTDKFGLAGRVRPLTRGRIEAINRAFRDRIRSVQVLDSYVGRIFRTLSRTGALANTYVVFSSDNGYHMGEHRLPIGKYTQFETDVRVPLVIRGPGIAAGASVSDLASNIDLAPTFADMTHTTIPAGVSTDGLSLLPRLTGQQRAIPRRYLLLSRAQRLSNSHERGGVYEPAERVVPSSHLATISNFDGVVTTRWKLIRYISPPHHEELYDLKRDPLELTNLLAHGEAAFTKGAPDRRLLLHGLRSALARLRVCHGADCTIS